MEENPIREHREDPGDFGKTVLNMLWKSGACRYTVDDSCGSWYEKLRENLLGDRVSNLNDRKTQRREGEKIIKLGIRPVSRTETLTRGHNVY